MVVSLADRGGIPFRADRYLARLHTPDTRPGRGAPDRAT